MTERPENATGDDAGTNADWKSDGSIVPAKPANKDAAEASAESAEERDPAKRNAEQDALHRTRSRTKGKSRGLLGVREAARKDSKLKFTALLHHVDETALSVAFFALKKTAAVGVDAVTWHEYEQKVETNLADLHGRIHRGAYRAKPSLRSYLPKADGRQRPIGVAALEDKIVQRAVATVLEAIYEQDFLGFSYGFRPGKSQHDALDALSTAITSKRVNWILDADIEGFFDNIDHDWLIEFLEHRIGDRRILRLIRKWLRAGVSEDGEWSETTVGAQQGAVISPLLANVYLHYVFDLWIEWWRTKRCCGDVIVVRFADDFVIGFENRDEAQACLEELHARLAKFGLKLHDGKTRLIEAEVPVRKKLTLNVWRMNVSGVRSPTQVDSAVERIKETYAQVGLEIEVNTDSRDWPQTVEDLKTGDRANSPGYIKIYDAASGQKGPFTDEYMAFIDSFPKNGSGEVDLYFLLAAYGSNGIAVTTKDLPVQEGEVNYEYVDKAFVNDINLPRPQTPPHELLHVLAPESPGDADMPHYHNVLSYGSGGDDTVYGRRRIFQEQEEMIDGHPSVKKP